MASQQIILIDIPTRHPRRCWSANSWNTRILLNFKGLDYKTEWLDYPDVKSRLEGRVPPNAQGAAYTAPAVFFPDGAVVMDSRVIAAAVEERHPSPPLHLDSTALARLEALLPTAASALLPLYLARAPRDVLGEGSLAYWYRTRAETYGMPVDDYERAHPPAECWAAARPALEGVTALLRETDGPFFLGREVSYADLEWAAYLVFWRTIGEDRLRDLLSTAGGEEAHLALLEGVKEWTLRDDH